jgi:hypothetical protein
MRDSSLKDHYRSKHMSFWAGLCTRFTGPRVNKQDHLDLLLHCDQLTHAYSALPLFIKFTCLGSGHTFPEAYLQGSS